LWAALPGFNSRSSGKSWYLRAGCGAAMGRTLRWTAAADALPSDRTGTDVVARVLSVANASGGSAVKARVAKRTHDIAEYSRVQRSSARSPFIFWPISDCRRLTSEALSRNGR